VGLVKGGLCNRKREGRVQSGKKGGVHREDTGAQPNWLTGTTLAASSSTARGRVGVTPQTWKHHTKGLKVRLQLAAEQRGAPVQDRAGRRGRSEGWERGRR